MLIARVLQECFTVKGAEANFVHYQDRRNIVHKALLCLKKHNPLYQNIIIDCNQLE